MTTLERVIEANAAAERMAQPHAPTKFVYYRRSNRKHAHETKHGTRYRNHWFDVYKCPVCGRLASHGRQRVMCRGAKATTPSPSEDSQ